MCERERERENRNDVPNMAETVCCNGTRHTIEYDAMAALPFSDRNAANSGCPGLSLRSWLLCSLVRWSRIATYMCF